MTIGLHFYRLLLTNYISLPVLAILAFAPALAEVRRQPVPRERISIDADWRFQKNDPPGVNSASLLYDVRPQVTEKTDTKDADAKPEGAAKTAAPAQTVLKPWILPTGNSFIKDPARAFVRPAGNPGGDVSYVQPDFDDSAWQQVNLPHDWAIDGPFNKQRRCRRRNLPYLTGVNSD